MSHKKKQKSAKSRDDIHAVLMMAKAPPYVDEIMNTIRSNKNPSDRLSKLMKYSLDKFIAAYRTFLLEVARQAEPDKDWHESNFTLENEDVFALHAFAALDLDSNQIADFPILRAFRKANLDPTNPISWRVLMMILCWSHFPPKRTVGNRAFWTAEKYCKLLREVQKAKPIYQQERWENAACTNLSKKKIFKRNNQPVSAKALSRALSNARDCKQNYALSRLVDGNKRLLREDHERRGHVWPPVHLADTVARAHKVECALRDNDQRMDSLDVKSDTFKFDDKDMTACFKLLNELRTRDHDGLLAELLAVNAQSYHFLVTLLRSRLAADTDEVQKALVDVSDYDSFLKVVENVIAADRDAALEAVIENVFRGDVDPSTVIVSAIDALANAEIAYDTKRDEAISNALSEFYCEQLAVGNISLSQAMARAGMICRADFLGESCD
jgi:hypothetical protein